MVQNLKNFCIEILVFIGGISYLTEEVYAAWTRGKFEWRLLIDQIYQIGVRSLGLIATMAITVGMVITFQSGMGLTKFGGTLYLPKSVAAAILWELGPLFTALMVAARAGAGMTSEIGSMMVTQQIDAIRALGTSPIRKIVVPRVVACLIALPVLIALADILGLSGSLIVGSTQFHLDPQFFLTKITRDMRPFDFLTGFCKSFFFSFFISIPACYFGLGVREGAKEVGIATTKSVVVSSILILIGDFFLTKIFWLFS